MGTAVRPRPETDFSSSENPSLYDHGEIVYFMLLVSLNWSMERKTKIDEGTPRVRRIVHSHKYFILKTLFIKRFHLRSPSFIPRKKTREFECTGSITTILQWEEIHGRFAPTMLLL